MKKKGYPQEKKLLIKDTSFVFQYTQSYRLAFSLISSRDLFICLNSAKVIICKNQRTILKTIFSHSYLFFHVHPSKLLILIFHYPAIGIIPQLIKFLFRFYYIYNIGLSSSTKLTSLKNRLPFFRKFTSCIFNVHWTQNCNKFILPFRELKKRIL